VKKLAALILLGSTLSLWAQDKPHRFFEAGLDAGASFANSYLRTGDIFAETIALDVSKMAEELGDGLGVFAAARGAVFVNINPGARWGFGLFAGLESLGQFKIPQSMVRLLAEGYQPDKTYSDTLGLGAAVFAEAGFWASAKIRRIKFTVRPAYFLPLVYANKPKVNYSFAIKDNGAVEMKVKYDIEILTPLPLEGVEGFDDFGSVPGNINVMDMLDKGGVDLSLRAEYPLRRNLMVGGFLSHIPLVPSRLSDRYSMTDDFTIEKSLGDILINNDFDIKLPNIDPKVDTAHQTRVSRPFKIGFDAVYRPFAIKLITIKPMAALVFNSIYDAPFYLDFGIAGELNLANLLVIGAGTRFEDLVWKQRAGLSLNFRILELILGITTQSQQFLRSFQGAGFAVDLGVRVGY
jgi:hypothetical protein